MKKEMIILFFLIIVLSNFINASDVGLIENSTWQNNLTGVRFSATAFGDIDGDADQDIVLTGCLWDGGQECEKGTITKIYINNGSTFTENSTWQNNLTAVGWGATAFGDIDNDGDLDLVLGGCTNVSDQGLSCNEDIITKIYINNGSTFTENSTWQENLTGVFDSSIAFGDIDNDGDLDFILIGKHNTGTTSKVYINNKTTFTENSTWQNALTAVYEGQVALGDVDNDGYLDLALTGDSGSDYTNFYINNRTSFIASSQWNQNLVNTDRSSLLFVNYNNDEYLDLFHCGHTTGDHCYLYRNNGSALELNQTRDDDLPALYRASIAFGDYDNDGDLDLAAMGNEHGRTEILENNEVNNYYFQSDSFASLNVSDEFYEGSLAWGDVDNDGDLDLVLSGLDFVTTILSKIFINNNTIINTLPQAPNSSFSSNYTNGVLNLSWGNGSDAETPTLGLYYNLMIGNSTNNHTIVSGVYGGSSGGGGGAGGGASGYFGNMMQRKSISLNVNLSNGIYRWYVQTIDTGLAKSEWSEMQSLIITNDTIPPNITSVSSSSITSSSAVITWTTNESANSSVYYGTTTSTDSFSGNATLTTSHSISLSGLSASTTYYYNVSSCDYWGNCNISIQYSFTTSAADSGSPGGGGGSPGGGIITPPATISEFDVDFSTTNGKTVESQQGDIKTFSFQGEVTHKITATEVTTNSIKLLIESDPIILILNIGETKQVDINEDNIYDFEIKLLSIISGKAKFTLTKLEGADIVASEELEEEITKEALFDVKVSISNLFNIVKSGREIIANIEVLNVNNIGQVDVLVEYSIVDKENNTIAQGSDTLAVEAVASFVRSLTVPYNIKPGTYYFNVDVSYKDTIMASGNAEFKVIKTYEIIIAVSILALILAGIFFYLWRIKKKEEKDIGFLKRQISKLKNKSK